MLKKQARVLERHWNTEEARAQQDAHGLALAKVVEREYSLVRRLWLVAACPTKGSPSTHPLCCSYHLLSNTHKHLINVLQLLSTVLTQGLAVAVVKVHLFSAHSAAAAGMLYQLTQLLHVCASARLFV